MAQSKGQNIQKPTLRKHFKISLLSQKEFRLTTINMFSDPRKMLHEQNGVNKEIENIKRNQTYIVTDAICFDRIERFTRGV